MKVVIRIGARVRHPFFPELNATPAVEASGWCDALSGSLQQLMDAPPSARPTRAVFVLRNPENPFLRDADRDALWSRYQVPVFTILLGSRGKQLAYECEAQAGMHVATNCLAGSKWVMFFDGERQQVPSPSSRISAKVESCPCECGRTGHRLLPLAKASHHHGLDAVPAPALAAV